MATQMRQQLKLSQQLTMTPQLLAQIKLLQLSRTELLEKVEEELLDNPVIENADEETGIHEAAVASESTVEQQDGTEDTTEQVAVDEIEWENYLESYNERSSYVADVVVADDSDGFESMVPKHESLSDYLNWQICMLDWSEKERDIAQLIIGNMDADGYFKEPSIVDIARELGVGQVLAKQVLESVQMLDPIGVGARNIEECLLIQVLYYGNDEPLVIGIIKDHLSSLETKNYRKIARALHCSEDEAEKAAQIVLGLDPFPGKIYSKNETNYIIPDINIRKIGDEYFINTNDDGMPKLRISAAYRKALSGSSQEKEYIEERLRSAQWLIDSIQRRQKTIVRVTESIVKFQRDFFEKGHMYLKPLILADVANDIDMHSSTVSRVTSNKYADTPHGIICLKYFFNQDISKGENTVSAVVVQNRIKQILDAEDPQHPVSDQKITDILKEENITIARRTVAKYRDRMGVLSALKRK